MPQASSENTTLASRFDWDDVPYGRRRIIYLWLRKANPRLKALYAWRNSPNWLEKMARPQMEGGLNAI